MLSFQKVIPLLCLMNLGVTTPSFAEEDAWGRDSQTSKVETPTLTRTAPVVKRKKSATHAKRAPASYRPVTVKPPVKPESSLPTDAAPSGEDSFGLTGSWGGVRKNLEEKGIGIALVYKGDWGRNLSGGVEQKSGYIDNLDLKISLDAEKAFGVKGLSFFFYGLGNSGVKRGVLQSATTGAAQGVDNIEVSSDDFKLYELWAQYQIEDLHLSVLFGLHDLNSEFYATDSSTLYLNPAYGIGTSLAQTGIAGPSIFPYTAPALRLKLEPSKQIYFQSGIFNGPSTDMATNGSHFLVQPAEGFLVINELGFTGTESAPYKFSLGYWNYTRAFATISDPTVKAGNSGEYVMADYSLNSKFSTFARYGIASSEVNSVKDSLEFGVVGKGIIPFRPDDRMGIGLSHVTPSDGSMKAENIFEATYRIEILKGLAIQPDFQYTTIPGMNGATPNSLLSQLRVEVSL